MTNKVDREKLMEILKGYTTIVRFPHQLRQIVSSFINEITELSAELEQAEKAFIKKRSKIAIGQFQREINNQIEPILPQLRPLTERITDEYVLEMIEILVEELETTSILKP
jgi:hypothetical protein